MKEELVLRSYMELKESHKSAYHLASNETSCCGSSCYSCYSCGDSCQDGGSGE